MGLGLQLLVLRLLATATTLPLQTSLMLAVETALLHNFVWHERWTWADRKRGASRACLSPSPDCIISSPTCWLSRPAPSSTSWPRIGWCFAQRERR
jgi:hypothetical protein